MDDRVKDPTFVELNCRAKKRSIWQKTKINNNKFIKSSELTKLYLIALSTVAGLSIAGQILIQSILRQQSNNANTVKKASNERTLSQQLSKAALVLDFASDPLLENRSLTELKNVTQQLKKSHVSLQQNNNSEIVNNLFAAIEYNYHALINSAEGLIELVKKEQSGAIISPSFKRVLVQEIVLSENKFSEGMNRIALQYSKEAKERITKLKKIEFALLVITLTVLVLEGLFIFRPAVRQIVSTVEKLLVTQTELQNSKARYLAIIEDQTELICRFLPDRTISFLNSAFCDYFELDKNGSIGQKITNLNSRYNFDLLTRDIIFLTPEKPAITREQCVCRSGFSTRFLQWRNCGIFDLQGNLIEVQSVGRDITESKQAEYLAKEKIRLETEISERKKSETALIIAEEKYRNIFENAIEGIFQISAAGDLLSVNPALAKMYGYSSAKQAIAANFTFENRALYVNFKDFIKLKKLLERQETIYNFELQIYRLDRRAIWLSINIRTVGEKNGNISYYEGSAIDITDKKKAREQLIKSAFYDNLTDLPNRTLFLQRLKKVAKQKKNSLFAVLFVDLDRFKAVNDTLGHEVGDRLLIEIARRLEAVVRNSDTVCRWGGDEFVILLNSIASKDDAIKIADRIQEKLTLPLTIDEHQIFPSGSVGIALSSLGYEAPEELLRNADAAMYQAKAAGKSRYYLLDKLA